MTTTEALPTSLATHPYLVRNWEGHIFQCGRVFTTFLDVNRTKRIIADMFHEVEHDHWDHSKLKVVTGHPRDGTDDAQVVHAAGFKNRGGEGQTVANSTAGVRKVLRRIRDTDAATLEEIDKKILELQAQIRHQRDLRKTHVEAAWRRGRDVFVYEIAPPDDTEPRRYFPED